MAIQVLPTRTDTARYTFEIELDENTYTLEFEWNDRDSGWYMSILDDGGDPILTGQRVVLHYPLARRYRDSRLPPGLLMAIDTSETDIEAGYADLGDRVKLIYTPLADLTA